MPNRWQSMRALMKEAWTQVERPRQFILACVLGVLLCVQYPTDLQSYRSVPADSGLSLAFVTDHYLRFVNTAAQAALPLLLQDKIGMVQFVYTAIGTTLATHGLKRLVNRLDLWGLRLGERPSGTGSLYNMPSGHSSMASCAAYFVARRYGWLHALYLIPILLLTMYARVALNAHTVAAVIAGALIGLLMAAIFTSKRGVAAQPVRT
jgi:lipid A 1-phosphatase